MGATTQAKRLRRVEKRSLPEVLAAVHEGKLSVRIADELLYLSPARQRAELAKRIQAAEQRERITELVTTEIRDYLDTCEKVDLLELNSRLRSAVSAETRQILNAR